MDLTFTFLLTFVSVFFTCTSAELSKEKFLKENVAKNVLPESSHLPGVSGRREKRGLFNGKEQAQRQAETVRDSRTLIINSMVVMCRNKCWNEWTDWGPCSGPCNTGSRIRTRTKKTPPPECRNIACIGGSSQSQACMMDCGVGGRPARDHCACLPGYTDTCCSRRITCPKPPTPDNGYIGGNAIWPAYYNTRAVYFCLPGFALIGQEQRRCKENGQWTGTNPTCTKIECGVPMPIENGEVINRKSVYLFNNVIGYECDIGYELKGASDRKCTVDESGNGIWNIHPPTCEARVCGNPGALQNGQRTGSDFTFNNVVTFSCRAGYTLIGSASRRCLSTGTWSGRQPVCKEVLCPMVENPPHGHISSRESLVDTVIIFSCDTGYRLDGDKYIACLPNGIWNGTVPECKAIGCEHPGSVPHGAVENSGLLLGNKVQFYCHSGYVMHGPKEATCQADGSWSHGLPRCEACPMNFYKTGPANGGSCTSCPDNSHSVTIATANQRQCICDRGYSGNPGGPCTKVKCGLLEAPENGRVVSCSDGFGEKCVFDCDDGHILIRGSSVRTCLYNNVWDGVETACQVCPKHTYKAGPSVCLPCPPKSTTPGAANSIQECVCIDGYDGPDGGECKDVDECTTKKDKCGQSCRNTIGGYTCDCTIPGHKLNKDGRTCRAENECKNLTQTDAPENGGLICHHYTEQNSKMCTLKCNPGFEIASSRHNAYETCGPVTGYIWSHQKVIVGLSLVIDEEALLPPCIEQFFPDLQLEADSAYFVRACNDLTEAEKFVAKREFAKTLTDQGVCWQRNTQVCDMRNVNIVCGTEYVRRRKRGIGYEEIAIDAVNIKFNIFANKSESQAVNCKSKICPMLRIPNAYCERFCLPAYNRFLRSAVMNAKRQLTNLFETGKDKLTFSVAERVFEPSDDDDEIINVSDVIVGCEEGMKSLNTSMCVPCSPGTYYSKENNDCLDCPVGHYQSDSKQNGCLKCPVGTTTSKTGSSNCTVCPSGTYGEDCANQCGRCNHGDCDPVSGSCVCHSGWQGNTCQQDIPGCSENSCHPGVGCTDVPAPGTGFVCGACPPNTTGNGIFCTSLTDS